MGKKRHVKVFVVYSPNLEKETQFSPEGTVELSLALNSIKARCFSSTHLGNVSDTGEIDWETRQQLMKTMISISDAVAVIGTELTSEMIEEIEFAVSCGKKICTTTLMNKLLREKGINPSNEKLREICGKILDCHAG